MTGRGDGDGRSRRIDKAPGAFRTIGEVAAELDVPQHVLRFWESKFAQIRPLKRGGGRRYYRPEDVELLRGVRRLLYGDGYTIKGVQKLLREHGARALAGTPEAAPAQAAPVQAAPSPAAPSPPEAEAVPADRLRAAVTRALDELAELSEILRRRRL